MSAYLGHLPAAALQESVERGDMLSVDLGRTVRHVRLPDRAKPLAMRTGPRAPFATCCRCGTFAEVSYIVGTDPCCSLACST